MFPNNKLFIPTSRDHKLLNIRKTNLIIAKKKYKKAGYHLTNFRIDILKTSTLHAYLNSITT